MARPISDEELQLKKRARRRLVGAIVLVSAVAVILPMVLDSEPKSVNKNVDIQIPPSDATDFKPKSAPPTPTVIDGTTAVAPPLSVATPEVRGAAPDGGSPTAVKPDATASPMRASDAAKSAANAGSAAQVESTSAQNDREKPAARPGEPEPKQKAIVRLEDHKPPTKESKASSKDTSASSAAYIVQVAALSDVARVKQLRKQIAGAGVKSYVEVVSTKSGDVTRIRAGPYSTREAAERARTQLKKLGLDGKVVPK